MVYISAVKFNFGPGALEWQGGVSGSSMNTQKVP